MSDKSFTKIQVHFLMVFSSASRIDFRICSIQYCLKKRRHHKKRCFGCESEGALSFTLSQISEKTYGVTPKNDLSRLSFVLWLREDFELVYRLPNLKNVAIYEHLHRYIIQFIKNRVCLHKFYHVLKVF